MDPYRLIVRNSNHAHNLAPNVDARAERIEAAAADFVCDSEAAALVIQ